MVSECSLPQNKETLFSSSLSNFKSNISQQPNNYPPLDKDTTTLWDKSKTSQPPTSPKRTTPNFTKSTPNLGNASKTPSLQNSPSETNSNNTLTHTKSLAIMFPNPKTKSPPTLSPDIGPWSLKNLKMPSIK